MTVESTRPPLPKPRVHAAVVRQLGQRILSGGITPGEVLPNQVQLCADLSVSRTALREAIRVLTAKGLVETRPRTGTRVRPRDAWNLLDPDVLGWREASPDRDFVRSLMEARHIIEPAAAELAAARATAEEIARIEAALLEMVRWLSNDIEACCRADLDFHSAILAASHNVVLQQLVSTISAALMIGFRQSTHLAKSYELTLSAHSRVLDGIRQRDPEGSRAAMLDLLAIAADDLALEMQDARWHDRDNEGGAE
jgi:DNA-binding FadR family transcriptional regulator